MIKKHKNKCSKPARISEEERIRYAQYRAELELEARRRKQQLIATFTKNKLKREEAFSRLNIAKLNEKWRYVLRQIKCREIYENVKHLCESFDKVIKLKSKTLRRLHNELKIANEDHRRLQEVHIVLINNIIEKYKQRLKDLHEVYKLHNTKSNKLVELNFLQNCMRKNCKEIESSISKKNKIVKEEQSITKTQNAVHIHNVMFLEENVASNLVHQSFINMENLWKQIDEILTEYERITKNKRKQYKYLKGQDNIHQLYIVQYPKVHLQLQNFIESLKRDIQKLSVKRKDQIAKLKSENIDIKEKIKYIKQQFIAIQIIDFTQLKKLTVFSNDVLKNLQRSMRKGFIILEIITICSALEPFLFNLNKHFMQDAAYTKPFDSTVAGSSNKIDKFWEQYNHMTANNILLKKECNKLCSENKRLRYKLQACLITVSGVPTICPVASTSI